MTRSSKGWQDVAVIALGAAAFVGLGEAWAAFEQGNASSALVGPLRFHPRDHELVASRAEKRIDAEGSLHELRP